MLSCNVYGMQTLSTLEESTQALEQCLMQRATAQSGRCGDDLRHTKCLVIANSYQISHISEAVTLLDNYIVEAMENQVICLCRIRMLGL